MLKPIITDYVKENIMKEVRKISHIRRKYRIYRKVDGGKENFRILLILCSVESVPPLKIVASYVYSTQQYLLSVIDSQGSFLRMVRNDAYNSERIINSKLLTPNSSSETESAVSVTVRNLFHKLFVSSLCLFSLMFVW